MKKLLIGSMTIALPSGILRKWEIYRNQTLANNKAVCFRQPPVISAALGPRFTQVGSLGFSKSM